MGGAGAGGRVRRRSLRGFLLSRVRLGLWAGRGAGLLQRRLRRRPAQPQHGRQLPALGDLGGLPLGGRHVQERVVAPGTFRPRNAASVWAPALQPS